MNDIPISSLEQRTEHASLPLGRKLALSLGDFAFSITWSGLEAFLLYFYTDVLGLSPWQAGGIFTLGLLWDAFCDPIVGALVDRTNSRWGRFTPWIVVGGPVVAALMVLVYLRPGFGDAALLAYVASGHLALRTACAVTYIPVTASLSRIVTDAEQRSELASSRMQLAAIGGIFVALIYPAAISQVGIHAQARAFTFCTAVLGAAVIGGYWGFARLNPEPPATGVAAGKRSEPIVAAFWKAASSDLRIFARILARNSPLVRVTLATVALSIAMTLSSKTTIYYFKYYIGQEEFVRPAVVAHYVALLGTAPIWAWAAKRYSKRSAWIACCLICALSCAVLVAIPRGSGMSALIVIAFMKVGIAGFSVLWYSMLPDTIEVNELLLGSRDEGKIFAIGMICGKLSLAAAAFVVGAVMSSAGFVANRPQDPTSLLAVRVLFAGLPCVGALISAAVIWNYRLDSATHGRIREELAALAMSNQS